MGAHFSMKTVYLSQLHQSVTELSEGRVYSVYEKLPIDGGPRRHRRRHHRR